MRGEWKEEAGCVCVCAENENKWDGWARLFPYLFSYFTVRQGHSSDIRCCNSCVKHYVPYYIYYVMKRCLVGQFWKVSCLWRLLYLWTVKTKKYVRFWVLLLCGSFLPYPPFLRFAVSELLVHEDWLRFPFEWRALSWFWNGAINSHGVFTASIAV